MSKRKIYWWIQQIDSIGGTEMVTINLANHLADKYDITLIVSAEVTGKIAYEINSKIKIINLGLKKDFIRYDQSWRNYTHNHRYLTAMKLMLHSANNLTFNKNKIKEKVAQYIGKNDVLICSSYESYFFAPKHSPIIFHYHFDANSFFSPLNKRVCLTKQKPDKLIFLSENIKNAIVKRNPKLKKKAFAISNPTRFKSTPNFSLHGNRIIFVGRYTKQKNPLLALKIMNEIKKAKFDCRLDMYGEGSLLRSMQNYIKKNNLTNYVAIHNPTTNISEIYKQSDLLLMPSSFEGYGLSKVEANAFSIPCVLKNWGPNIVDITDFSESAVIEGDDPKKYAKKIIEMLNPKNIIQYKKKAYEYSKKFQIKPIIQKWISFLDNC